MTELSYLAIFFAPQVPKIVNYHWILLEGNELRVIRNTGTMRKEVQIKNRIMRRNYDRRATYLHHHPTGPEPSSQDQIESYFSALPSCKHEPIVIQDMNHRRKILSNC